MKIFKYSTLKMYRNIDKYLPSLLLHLFLKSIITINIKFKISVYN